MRTLFFLIFSILSLLFAGCSDNASQNYSPNFTEQDSTLQQYQFAIHPLHNPTRLYEVFNPLMDYLNQNLTGVTFTVEASKSYAHFNEKLKQKTVAFALPNPYQTLMALETDYQVIAKMGDDQNFKGIFLVRKDSGITQPSDLKGKAVSYPAPTALAATMLPQHYLQQHGINVTHDIENKYVGSQESSIMNVFVGNTAAAATWPPPWRALSDERPELKEQLKVIWQTQSLPNNSIVVRDDVPPELIKQVQILLSHLHETEEGQKILHKMYLSKFELADNDTYQPVKEFVENFAKSVRPLSP